MKNCNFLSQMLVADYMPVKEFMPLSSIGTTLIWAMLLMPVMNTVNVLQVRFNLPFLFLNPKWGLPNIADSPKVRSF